MSDLEHAGQLHLLVKADIRALKKMLESPEDFTDEIFGFRLQQAAEKSLKAWISYLGERYSYDHNLLIFIQILRDLSQIEHEYDELVELNHFAVKFRYEAISRDDVKLDREYWTNKIENLYRKVEEIIKK